jgi:hypothetical protein
MVIHARMQDLDDCVAAHSGATGAVVVDVDACHKLSAFIRSRSVPEDREDSSLTGLSAREVGNFYFLLVALCHQTSPRGRKPVEGTIAGRHVKGWDYLSGKLETAARVNRAILSPECWALITEQDVSTLFRDEGLGERLSDPAGRAVLIQDLGQKMLRHSWESAEELYALSHGQIATGSPNLLELLSEFRAYDDPVQKKSYFFLALMRNAGLWTYADPEKLGAPVDYHEVRGHLRLGTVRVRGAELRAKLLTGKDVTPEEDVCLRQAVHQAIMLVSEHSGLRNPSQVHYLFWNVFRSCCTREDPHCYSCPPTCSLPARYVPLALFPDGTRHCPFSNLCRSAGREPKFLEHSFETDYY